MTHFFKPAVAVAIAASAMLVAAHGSAATPHGAALAARLDRSEEMDLAIGESKAISADDVANYSEGSPGIADVKLTTDGKQFVVAGVKPGITTLLLIYKDGSHKKWTITISARSPDAVEKELTTLLADAASLRIRRVGERFFIEGVVGDDAEQKRVAHITSLYPGQVESLVDVGTAHQDRDVNVRLDFYFIQFNRDSGFTAGVGWPGVVGGTGVITNALTYDFIAKTTTTATASVVNQPLPFLDIASHSGWAKVLRQATLVTGNGTEAKYSNGGEQNYAIQNNLVANIRPISFGLDLTVLPRFDASTRDMTIKVAADIGDLTPPVSSTPLPGRTTSKLETLVHLKLGQSVVLSGISTRSQRHEKSGLPILSDIPIIGVLFGSHDHDESDVEGAIFIIPSVIDSLPRASTSTIDAVLKQYQAYSGAIAGAAPLDSVPPVIGGAVHAVGAP